MSSSISLYFGKQIQKKMNEIKPMRVHTSPRPPPTSSKVFLMLYLGLVQKSPLDTLRDLDISQYNPSRSSRHKSPAHYRSGSCATYSAQDIL